MGRSSVQGSPLRILLTGKNGQVGHELLRALSVVGEVFAVGSADCDFNDASALRALVHQINPDFIVNPAAYTAVDRAESERETALAVNAVAPGVLAEESERCGATIVHFSTDYVFDGEAQKPYAEGDHANPLSIYGATKLAGEAAVAGRCPRHFIFRTGWVYGVHGRNFPKTILRLAAERDSLSVVSDQHGAPTAASLLADTTAHAIRQAAASPDEAGYGLYHVAASGSTTWFDYAVYLVERARALGASQLVGRDRITPLLSDQYPVAARRPRYSRLDCAKFGRAFGLRLPDWREGVDRFVQDMLGER